MGGGSYGYLEQNGQRLYITGFDEYKSTEEKIGVWIDGKPIYRKVVRVTGGWQFGGEVLLNHNISNVDEIWLENAFYKRNDNTFQMMPNVHTDMESWASSVYDISKNQYRMYIGKLNGFKVVEVYLIFNYTKATD